MDLGVGKDFIDSSEKALVRKKKYSKSHENLKFLIWYTGKGIKVSHRFRVNIFKTYTLK